MNTITVLKFKKFWDHVKSIKSSGLTFFNPSPNITIKQFILHTCVPVNIKYPCHIKIYALMINKRQ